MKIVLNRAEIEALKEFKKELQECSNVIANAMEEKTGTVGSFTDFATGCKFANITMGFNGVTINIHPEFVADFLIAYGKMVAHTTDVVVATVKACYAMDKIVEDKLNKWIV